MHQSPIPPHQSIYGAANMYQQHPSSSTHSQPNPARECKSLVNGDVNTGTLTTNVHASVLQQLQTLLARWDASQSRAFSNWWKVTPSSRKRCVYHASCHATNTSNPLVSENPEVACNICVSRKELCVLVGDNGPAVMSLPMTLRSAGATPQDGTYYVLPI